MRENICALIVGKRREGKSSFIVNELIPAYLKLKREVFIVYGKDNPLYEKISNHSQIHLYKVLSIEDVSRMLKSLYNCVVIFDDAQLLIGTRLDDDTRKLIINLGQTNVDAFFVFHSFTATTRELWTLCDIFEIFNVNESSNARKEFLTNSEVEEIDAKIKTLPKYGHFTHRR